jgi:hypothetical protein
MRLASCALIGALALTASLNLGCRDAAAPPVIQAPQTPSERALLLVAQDARAVGRVRVSELRGYLSAARQDELGEVILSKRFRLPVDVAREVDEIVFAAYQYGQADAVALLFGHFRAAELRAALAREASTEGGTAREAPSVNGERFYRVGQGDLYVAADDLIVVGSRAGLDRFLRRVTGAAPLQALPVTLGPQTIAAFRAQGPSSPEDLPPMLRQQALATGLREANGSLEREGQELVAVLSARFSEEDLARQAQARVLPFAKLLPTWTRNALPAAEVSLDGSSIVVRERIDAAKLEALAGTATTLVPR